MKLLGLLLAVSLTLAACKEEVAAVATPVAMTDEALGHYCQMFVADHPGPKAQVHLKGRAAPLWFSKVSDAVAYLHGPERDAEITGVFVSDMSRAESWSLPGPENWVPAAEASLVIDSAQPGGMGVPEAIPFGSRVDAVAFTRDKGGRVVAWGDIPEHYVRPDATLMSEHMDHEGMTQ